MQLPLPEQLNTQTVLRYLGAAGWTPDDSMQQLLARAEASLRSAATPAGNLAAAAAGCLAAGECGERIWPAI